MCYVVSKRGVKKSVRGLDRWGGVQRTLYKAVMMGECARCCQSVVCCLIWCAKEEEEEEIKKEKRGILLVLIIS